MLDLIIWQSYFELGGLAWWDCGKVWGGGCGFDVIKSPAQSHLLGVEGNSLDRSSGPLSNDPLSASNCCLGFYTSLCAFQEPEVMTKVVPSLTIPESLQWQ